MGALDPGLDRLRQQLVEEIRASESRTAQWFEALRARIGTVESGLGGLRHHEKTKRFRDEVREEFAKVDRRFLHVEARIISALERR